MRSSPQGYGYSNSRALIAFVLFVSSISLGVLSYAATPRNRTKDTSPLGTGVVASQIAFASVAPATSSGPGWSGVTSPNTTEQQLLSVSCASATDCWAVGYYYHFAISDSQTLIEHWDGSSWTIVSSPNALGQSNSIIPNRLTGVTCNSTADCWAVGYSQNPTYATLIEHWDGTSWSIVTSPNPTSAQNQLYGVACSSSIDCWAVGSYKAGSINSRNQTLAAHWDGNSWSVIPSPNTSSTESNRLTSVTCNTSSDCWGVGFYLHGSLTEHWDGTAWSIASSPPGGTLTSAKCSSAADCWAVGYYYSGNDNNGNSIYQTLIKRWDGTTWSIVPSPNTSPTQVNFLTGVTCASSSQCWAVGYAYAYDSLSETALLERWDGSSWSIVPAPTSTTTQFNYLNAVACTSNAQCWAVGYSDFQHILIENWNGSTWSITSSPSAAGGGSDNYLSGVACNSASDCWAVGQNSVGQSFIQHWDGTKWSIMFVPVSSPHFNSLSRVTCIATNNCWAVGYYSDNGPLEQTLTEHWNGSSWLEVASNNIVGRENYLDDVTCTSTNDCWAVGEAVGPTSDQMGQTLIEHWNGTSWSIVSSPNGATGSGSRNGLHGVTCISSSDCWAVGSFGNNSTGTEQPLTEHWDGSSWTIVAASAPAQQNSVYKVACASSAACWAVGYSLNSNGYDQALIEHWDGTAWQVVPVSTSPTDSSLLRDVTCTSISNCWAVGFYGGTLTVHWDGGAWSVVSSGDGFGGLAAVACPSSAQCWAVGEYNFGFQPTLSQTLIEVYSSTIPPLTNAGSRKTHGAAGIFDIDLPLTGTRGIECRHGGANGNYSVVFSFVNSVANCGTAATAGGTVVAGPNANQCTMNLTGVGSGQTINIELDNAVDVQNNTGNVSVEMGVLVGDTTSNGLVNSSDISQTQAQSGHPVTSNNFREDVTVNGLINSSDISLVQSQSGTALPPSPSTAPAASPTPMPPSVTPGGTKTKPRKSTPRSGRSR